MADFSSLDPETRCFALVGQYLSCWAKMESALHDCIQIAFKISPIATHILCANLGLQNKLNIVRTIVDVAAIKSDHERATFKRALRKIGDHSHYRNMIAHSPFGPDETGVKFEIVKAKGSYDPTGVIWDIQHFQKEEKAIAFFHSRLSELFEILKTSPIWDKDYRRTILAAALLQSQPAQIGGHVSVGGQGLYSLHNPPVRADPDSDPTNP